MITNIKITHVYLQLIYDNIKAKIFQVSLSAKKIKMSDIIILFNNLNVT